MKKININESQNRLLQLARVVDEICKGHNIPFFMVGGTMLGAIRHKGFIPWDDDMDFGVTYDHYFELIDLLNKELPEGYRCLWYGDDSPLRSFFFKVEDTRTVIDDPCIALPLNKKLGLSIDIFPIISCNEEEGLQITHKVYDEWMTNRKVNTIPSNAKWYVKMVKYILRVVKPHDPFVSNQRIKAILDSVEPGNKYLNVVSPQFWKVIWPKETFFELASYSFEDAKFSGPKDYDAYLSKCYKNYMQLPPEEKRRVHAENTYIR